MHRLVRLAVILLGAATLPGASAAQGWLTVEELGARLDKPAKPVSAGANAAAMWYGAYRGSFSRARGSACNFEPSCSHFSQEAVSRYGLLRGLLMTGDRLERCNQCLEVSQYPRRRGGPDGKLLDPVEDDDVWWWFEGGHKGEQRWREGLLNAPR